MRRTERPDVRTPTALFVVFASAITFTFIGPVSGQSPTARFVREVPWGRSGTWVSADLHVHTKFSDGANTVAEVADKARQNGCGVIAIADHGDQRLMGATPSYRAGIEAARDIHPDVRIIPALEWNLPPWDGQEHATVLVPPGPRQWSALAEFKLKFDDYHRTGVPRPRADEALQWLATTAEGAVLPVVIHNHPSRVETSTEKHVENMLAWRRVNDLVVGVEGAPGHQGATPIGAYSSAEPAIDRWDPTVARPGDAWDTLLQRGVDVTGAIAGSDFHDANPAGMNDRWPCQFSETWLRVPDVTEAGVLRALRAGSVFAEHGRIARQVELTVTAAGLPRQATVGEVIAVRPGSTVTASVSFVVPELDWQGTPNRIDAVEFFLITPAGVAVASEPVAAAAPHVVSHTLVVGSGGVVIRARGRRVIPDGPDLMFYTNAIRVTASRP